MVNKRILAAFLGTMLALTSVFHASPALAAGPGYWYAGGKMTSLPTTVNGARANFSVEQTSLAMFDYHTHAQIAGIKTIGGKRQIVEAGIHVNRLVNGDTKPRLFVGRQIDDVFQGYNTADAGWVDWAANPLNVGADLTGHVGLSKGIEIVYSGNAWWVRYDGSWVGYWTLTDWDNAGRTGFDDFDTIDWFGEAALDSAAPDCTDMGDGSFASTTWPASFATHSAWITSMRYIDSGVWTNANVTTHVTDSSKFSVHKHSGTTIFYGGPGFC